MCGEQPPFSLGMQILPARVVSTHIFVSTGYSLKFRCMKLSEEILVTVVRYYEFLTEEEFVYDLFFKQSDYVICKKKKYL